MGSPLPDMLPGLAQAGVGMTQGFLDLGTEIYNQSRNARLADELKKMGVEQGQVFSDQVLPFMQAGTDAINSGYAKSLPQFDTADRNLNAQKERALASFAPVKQAAREGLDSILARIGTADTNIRAAIQSQYTQNTKFIADTQNTVNRAVDAVRTNQTESIGNETAGLRIKGARQIATFADQARKSGWSESDIAAESFHLSNAVDTAITDTWTKSTGEVGKLLTEAEVSGAQMMTSMRSTVGGLNTQLAGETRAAELGSATLTSGAYDMYTGKLLGVAGAEASTLENYSGMQLDLDTMKAEFVYQNGLNVAADSQNRANAQAMAIDIPYQARRESIAFIANRPFQMPNFANLVNPGLQSMSTALSSWRQSQKSAPSQPSGAWGLGSSAIGAGGALGAAAIMA